MKHVCGICGNHRSILGECKHCAGTERTESYIALQEKIDEFKAWLEERPDFKQYQIFKEELERLSRRAFR